MTTSDHSSTPEPSTMTPMPVASTSTRTVNATSVSASPPSPSSSDASSTSSYVASSPCIDMDDDAFSFGTLPQMDAVSTEQWDASVFEEAVDSFVKQMEITPLDTTWLEPMTPTASSASTSAASSTSSSSNWGMWTADGAVAIPGLSPTRSDSTLSEEDLDFDLDLNMDMDVPIDEESMKLLAQFVESCQNPSTTQETAKFDFDLETLLASSSSSTPLPWDAYGIGSPDTLAGKQELTAMTPTPSPSTSS